MCGSWLLPHGLRMVCVSSPAQASHAHGERCRGSPAWWPVWRGAGSRLWRVTKTATELPSMNTIDM
eukprot:7084317-Prymnesium_polylepis.1